MAQYKVPQDVEADDKLLGPFNFRQFIYLIIATGMIALAWALFNLFPFLVIVPVPIIIFFGALALPLKKDQPMETYLAALVSYYLKPRKRLWEPGQAESTIRITAPKKVEVNRTKDLSQDEATNRLSFLAEIVDSEGRAIKSVNSSPIKDEVYAEANSTADMYETARLTDNNLENDAAARHQAIVDQMKTVINDTTIKHDDSSIKKFSDPLPPPKISLSQIQDDLPLTTENVVVSPTPIDTLPPINISGAQPAPQSPPSPEPSQPTAAFTNLANDKDLSIETIAKEANRLQQKHDDEVLISLR